MIMIILPNKDYNNPNNEKITTYQFLASVGCPVFDSILFDEGESITKEKLKKIREILKSEYCTIRYQYVRPSINPIRGGNKSKIDFEELKNKQIYGTQMWLLQPIDRTKNLFGINMYVNRSQNSLIIESVGRGFDVSDLNRGDISPQEIIMFNYPVEYGWQNEWWKYIKLNFVNQQQFEQDKLIRITKLKKFGLDPSENIFDKKFVPLDYSLIERLLNHINYIDTAWDKSNDYIVSISMNADGKLVFWDIQTPLGKSKILRRAK
jgi:hypothetical protein